MDRRYAMMHGGCIPFDILRDVLESPLRAMPCAKLIKIL